MCPTMEEDKEEERNDDTERFITTVYEELRRMAASKMAHESPQTIGPTALVHEAWIRIADQKGKTSDHLKNRKSYFSAAAEAMRRILVDRARARAAEKRGGEFVREGEGITFVSAPEDDDQILAVGDALERFELVDPESAELVKLKYFVGMTWGEISEVLDVPERTLRRRWTYARTWLHDALNKEIQGDVERDAPK